MVGAEDLKAEGNAEFKAGSFLKAAGLYTKALKESPESAVLYSNRSAALLKLKKVNKALADAEAAIERDPKWDKGYFRKAAALEALDRNKEALELYERAAELDPGNHEVAGKVSRLGKQLQQAILSSAPQQQATPADGSTAQGWSVADPQLQHFMQRVLSLAKAKVEAEGLQGLQHSISFYPPKVKDSGDEQMTQVGVSTAFDSPEVLQECLSWLRQTAAESNCTAAAAVINPAKVAFPQVWKHRDWPLGGAPQGVLLQLDSLKEKRLAFLPFKAGSLGNPIPLKDTFKLLEPLFR